MKSKGAGLCVAKDAVVVATACLASQNGTCAPCPQACSETPACVPIPSLWYYLLLCTVYLAPHTAMQLLSIVQHAYTEMMVTRHTRLFACMSSCKSITHVILRSSLSLQHTSWVPMAHARAGVGFWRARASCRSPTASVTATARAPLRRPTHASSHSASRCGAARWAASTSSPPLRSCATALQVCWFALQSHRDCSI